MDHISHLPSDALLDALDFLSFPDVIKCTAICKSMFDLLYCQPHLLFKRHLERDFPNYPPFENLQNLECVHKLVSFYRKCYKWERLASCDGVSPRYLHRSVVTDDGSMIFFGGTGQSNAFFSDTWKMTFNDVESNIIFQQIATTSLQPTPRGSCAMCVYDGNVFCFGGRDLNGRFLNCLMCLSLKESAWSEVHPCVTEVPGSPIVYPPHRWGHTIVQWNGLLILFGGGEYGRTFNDLWVLDLKSLQPDQSNGNWIMNRSWKQINAYTLDDDAEVSVQPLGRSGHACLVMQTHYMYIFGGNNLTQTFDDMWRIDLRKVSECFYGPDTMTNVDVPWEPIPTGVVHPEPQIGHVIAPLGSRRFILFGGRNVHGHKMISGTMIYDTQENSWEHLEHIENEDLIINRTGHCPLPNARGLFFFGGMLEGRLHTAEIISLDLFSTRPVASTTSGGGSHARSIFNFTNMVRTLSSVLNIEDDDNISPPSIQIIRGPDLP